MQAIDLLQYVTPATAGQIIKEAIESEGEAQWIRELAVEYYKNYLSVDEQAAFLEPITNLGPDKFRFINNPLWPEITEFLLADPGGDLQTFPGMLPLEFCRAVERLCRPYTPISEDRYNELLAVLQNETRDLFVIDNQIATIGNADGGYAIMPLQPDWQAYYRAKAT